ncbi:uncharacterized protein BO95DRAFT_500954 [Aspergillus brunneoviolaceus CBS 621.78]|uniref:Uncharacterized protein n=1 Tax=Aspergillus brunneoviolaceus CBS 621.78 TaxID=1450534 RepID=A0ACD1GM74_9EURO|nr:hypothetical protein BO95DRAFT_500954 [Aspergillus brunneoviolaceus CBS 621.78]RAH50430.1 hypothetical protein BO95DRAFT_500954 [Aspergillus brunneoviolaceus CBS 621.78]
MLMSGVRENGAFDEITQCRTGKYGNVHRELKARHVTFIALGGDLGTGLFLGIGRALGYFAGLMMMMAVGEMAAWLPVPGAVPHICSRYVDNALGFAVGWNTWFNATSAACSIIQYWWRASHASVAVWIVMLIVLLLAVNILAFKVYRESEFMCAIVKLCGVIVLLITALVIDLRGVPSQNRLGFHFWKSDGMMKEYIASGPTGCFLGLFSTLVNASFSLGGVETVVVAAVEAEYPRRRAIGLVFWHLLFFVLASSSASNAESPWVIAIQLAGIRALPSIANAVILIADISAGNPYVFMGSRYLFTLASNRQAPAIFLRCTKRGILIYTLLVTMSIPLLTYMSMGSSPSVAFQWFQNSTKVSILYTWIAICIAYLHFHAALKAQHVDRASLLFSFLWQPYSTYFILGYLTMVAFFNGFNLVKKTKWKEAEEADLFTDKAELDAIEWAQKAQ